MLFVTTCPLSDRR